ncbi:actinodin1 [Acipenser ruthenus]|uniref:actinodin1 n=1 Tax=Acipenser ruthenus TaxID=7906 RepID=UPI0027416D6D|nr:actinodin1 [Acipenser ruthenus]
MGHVEWRTCSFILTGVLLAISLIPDFLEGSPIGQHQKGDEGDNENMSESGSPSMLKKLVRSRRNISWYNQHPDFWNWYKYFTEIGNQEGLNELDRVYLKYLQNRNRAEGQHSYDQYLRHLGEVYKTCASSDDPNCITDIIAPAKPTPAKPAPIKGCDPYRDPYCQLVRVAPAPIKAPLSNHYQHYRAPVPFLSAQQASELSRICNPSDVECLQYHLRAAYGYTSEPKAPAPAPSYAYLGYDPNKAVKREVYHRYPNCDPKYDPYCVPEPAHNQMAAPPSRCNPLYDDNCNPLIASMFSSPLKPECDPYYDPSCRQEYRPKDEPVSDSGCDPRYDPYCRSPGPSYGESRVEPERYPMTQGKTKEGYACYVHYDEECYPVRSSNPSHQSAASTLQDCDPYDPSCPLYYSANNPMRSPQPQSPYHSASSPEAYHPHVNPGGFREGIIEPDSDCDPEYDPNCRLRRYESNPNLSAPESHHDDPQPSHDNRGDEGPSHDQPDQDPYEGRHESENAPYSPYSGYEQQQEPRDEEPDHRYDQDYQKK